LHPTVFPTVGRGCRNAIGTQPIYVLDSNRTSEFILTNTEDPEMRRFQERTSKSKAIFERARVDVPFGVHSTYRYADPYPLYFTRAQGTKL